MNNYYVYYHMKNGEIVYIGKGKGNRAWDTNRTRDDHSQWVEDCILDGIQFVHIAHSHLTSDEAYAKEKELIEEHGPDYNCTHEKCELCGEVYKNRSAHFRHNHIGVPWTKLD